MMSRGRSLLFGLALLGLACSAALGAEDRPVDLRIGRRMPDFTLRGADGVPVSLYGFAGKAGAVIVFTGTHCPVGNLYLPRLVELARTYGPRDVVFLAINSNASESAEDAAAHAREHGVSFPVLKDPDARVAGLAQVDRTSEVVVVDSAAFVRYRGAIDDQYGIGTRKPQPSKNYLIDALESVLARRPVEVASTPVEGCPIERGHPGKARRIRPAPAAITEALEEREKAEGPIRVGPVTYAADVAPIVQEKCQACHRPGQAGPFSLMSFEDARRWSGAIAEVVEDRRMPPWHADPRFGHFSNDRSLTSRQRATLLAWVDQGSPMGDSKQLPEPRVFPADWSIGKPDLVIELPQPMTVPSNGVVDYVHVSVPSNFDRDMWVQAAEIRPGVPSVVHHIIVYVEPPRTPKRTRPEHLVAYVPGDVPTSYPDGIAKKVVAGSKLIFQIHYTPDGTERVDRSRVGLVFAKAPVKHQAHTRFIENNKFRIPAGADDHEVKATTTLGSDIHLFSLSPHMHLRGKDFRYTATYPDGKSEVLLSVPAYDFGWQSAYVLPEPRAMPRGTRIDCLAHFDNSSKNPANPDPTATVTHGEQSFEERMMGYMDYVDDAPADWKP